MKNRLHRILKPNYKSVFGLTTLALLLSVLGIAVFPSKASASDPTGILNPLYVWSLPTFNWEYLRFCDHGLFSPALTQWISPAGEPTKVSMVVPYGTPSVALDFNFNGATCHSSGGSTDYLHMMIVNSYTSGVSDIVGDQIALDFNPGNPVGTYHKKESGFNFAPPGGFTATAIHTITLGTKTINQFPDAPNFRCVPAPITISSIFDFGPCPENKLPFPILITVLPPPLDNEPSISMTDIDCNSTTFDITSADPDGGPYTVNWSLDGVAQPGISFPGGSTTKNVSIPGNDPAQAHTIAVSTSGYYAHGAPTTSASDNDSWVVCNKFVPKGGLLSADCDAAKGWASDEDSPGTAVKYRILKDGTQIHEGTANENQLDHPGHGFEFNLADHKDYKQHIYKLQAEDTKTNGSGTGVYNDVGSAETVPACVTPKCAVTNSEGANPEIGVKFYITVKITYVPGSKGAAITDAEFNMLIRITGPSSPPPLYNIPNVSFTSIPLTPSDGEGIGRSDDVFDDVPGPYSVLATLTGPSPLPIIYCSGVGTSTVCDPVTSVCTPCDPVTSVCTVCDPVTSVCTVCDPVTSVCTVCDPVTSVCTPCDPVTSVCTVCDPVTSVCTVCDPLTDSDCPPPPRIVLKPYLAIYGDDVCSGGGDGSGNITTFLNDNYSGAGSQLATFALGVIKGYATAKIRDATLSPPILPIPPNGLSFANTEPSAGGFTLANCADNYTDPGDSDLVYSQPHAQIIANNSFQGIYRHNSSLTLVPTEPYAWVYNGSRLTVYVNGDITIMGDIFYIGGYPHLPPHDIVPGHKWDNLNDIPSVTFVASRNIYIDSSVTELDGTYVAKDTIYTCTGIDDKGTPEVSDDTHRLLNVNELYANCDSQLIVRGQLIAKSIKWLRTYKSLVFSAVSEHPYNLGIFPNAAELIINGPESYMSRPASGLPSSTGSKTYDSITSLPPIL